MIAILEVRSGWLPSDMERFFDSIGQPVPQITDVSVDGTTNTPGGGDDLEVALDIQIAAASYYSATGRPATIRVYWTTSFARGIRRATADGCDVCSISWGAVEARWDPSEAGDTEQAAVEAAEAGMIVFAASGDNDSSDAGNGPANVDFPASAPHIIGCGGTTKRGTDEGVWNDEPGSAFGEGTGGGFSALFDRPAWQHGALHGQGRMVPDVAANADPATGYFIVLRGEERIAGGTSAVAPLYAGLFAAFGQKLGFVTPTLWSHQACFVDITSGDNGNFRAMTGPDPCTGLGVPIGQRLAALLARSDISALQQIRDLTQQIQELSQENARLHAQLAARARDRASLAASGLDGRVHHHPAAGRHGGVI